MTFKIILLASILAAGCSTVGRQADTDSNASQSQASAPGSTMTTNASATATNGTFVSYDKAIADARASNKLVFVDIYTGWCTWCKKLDKEVYTDPQVQAAFAKNFATTKLDAESDAKLTYLGSEHSEKEVASSWNVNAFPTLVFLNAQEKPVYAYAGYLPTKDFLKLLDFVSSGDYQKNGGDFRTWLGTHQG